MAKRERSPETVGVAVGPNPFKSDEQSPQHNGYDHKDKKQRRDLDRTPPHNDSPPSSAIVTPDTTNSKASSSADGGSWARIQLVSRFSPQKSLESFGATIEERVLDKIKVITNKPTVKSGLETAASIDILNLTHASDPLLENVANIARRGALLMEEGLNKVNVGEEMLKLAFKEIRDIFNLT